MRPAVGLAIAILAGAHPAACAKAAAPAPSPAVKALAETCLLGGNGDPDMTIAACTRLLARPGQSDVQRAAAYNARGEARWSKRQCDLAIADQDEAIRLQPGLARAFVDRATCDLAKGDQRSALASYDTAITLAPKSYGAHIARARLESGAGAFDRALADEDAAIAIAPTYTAALDARAWTLFDLGRFDQAAEAFGPLIRLVPDDAYAVLWRHIARARAHHPDTEEFAAGRTPLRVAGWPAPLFDLFLGKTTYAAAAAKAPASPEGACESALVGGEYDLIRGESAAATTLIGQATNLCDRRGSFYLTARTELGRLKPAEGVSGREGEVRDLSSR